MDIPPNNIKALRKARELTLAQLEALTGITAQQLNRLEKGERRLNDSNMATIANALGCRREDLISDGTRNVVTFTTEKQMPAEAKTDDQIPLELAAKLSILTVAAENGVKLNAEQIDRLTEELRKEIQLLREQGHDEKPTPLAARFILKQHKLL